MTPKKRRSFKSVDVGRLVAYALMRRPDEFGLAPLADGSVPLKELLKALHEEEGYRHIRRSHLEEASRVDPKAGFEVVENRVRVKGLERPLTHPLADPPKLLYLGLRRRAWPVALKNGLSPAGNDPWVILAANEDMALRLGRRRDPEPILITVQALNAAEMGYVFRRVGEILYLADYLPKEVLHGPPPAEDDRPEAKKAKPKPVDKGPRMPEQPPGSIILEPEDRERASLKRKGIKKDVEWKRRSRGHRRKK